MRQRWGSWFSVSAVGALLATGCAEKNGSDFAMGESSTAAVRAGSGSGSSTTQFSGNFSQNGSLNLGSNSLLDGGSDDGGSSSLTMTIRDFKMWDASDPMTNPDFENVLGDDRGIVQTSLGSDGKPVYANPNGTTLTTHGQADFNEWYNDTPGMNINVQYPIVLTSQTGGIFGYDSRISGVALSATNTTKEFFPSTTGLTTRRRSGIRGSPHNYSFTTELHTVFTYNGGEHFNVQRRRRRLRLHQQQPRHRPRRRARPQRAAW